MLHCVHQVAAIFVRLLFGDQVQWIYQSLFSGTAACCCKHVEINERESPELKLQDTKPLVRLKDTVKLKVADKARS